MPLFLTLAAYTLVFLISPYNTKWHLGTAADRLALHMLPLAVFYAALSIDKEMGVS
jgi:hypothetical protein